MEVAGALQDEKTRDPKPLSAVLVDDEELALRGLRTRLERTGIVSVVGESSTGTEALEAVRTLSPDLLFLDIKLPGMTGLEVAAALEETARTKIVFVTAFGNHALRAFDVQAFDYLLKPFDDQRLLTTLERARAAVALHDAPSGELAMPWGERPVSDFGPRAARAPDRLVVRTGGRLIFVRLRDIDWVEASGDYVSVHVDKKAWLIRDSIAALAARYTSRGLVRIHRSTMVNLERVQELRPLANGEFVVVLHGGVELKMSRTYRSILDSLVGPGY
jgi:two-component system LytT family response regulator